jgi:hypothetical protein
MALTSGEYEAQANRLRSQMGETVDKLRRRTLRRKPRRASECQNFRGVAASFSRAHAIQARLPSPGLASLCGSWRRLASATERVSRR